MPPKVFVSGRQVSIIMGMGGVVHCRATGIPVPTSTSWFRLPNVRIGSAEAAAVHQRQINSTRSDLVINNVSRAFFTWKFLQKRIIVGLVNLL